MRILTRNKGQSIIVKDNIKITVKEIHGKFIKLGIEAPKDISILRSEIIEKGGNVKKNKDTK